MIGCLLDCIEWEGLVLTVGMAVKVSYIYILLNVMVVVVCCNVMAQAPSHNGEVGP